MSVGPVVPGDEAIKFEQSRAAQKSAPAAKDRIAAKKAAREFEAVFAGMMLKSMRDTVGKDGMTYGGHGEDVYRSLLDQEYAESISETGTLGLANLIEKELLKSMSTGDEKSGGNDENR